MGQIRLLTAKAIGPLQIKKQITQNTVKIEIPPAIRKKMRSVFHSSEPIPFDTRDLDPVGFLPTRDGAHDPNLLDEDEAELEQAFRVPGDSPAGQQPSAVLDQVFLPTAGHVVDQDFAPGGQNK